MPITRALHDVFKLLLLSNQQTKIQRYSTVSDRNATNCHILEAGSGEFFFFYIFPSEIKIVVRVPW